MLGVLGEGGTFKPVFGNMVCEEIEVESTFIVSLNKELFTKTNTRSVDSRMDRSAKTLGTIVFTRPYSGYEIVYTFNSGTAQE